MKSGFERKNIFDWKVQSSEEMPESFSLKHPKGYEVMCNLVTEDVYDTDGKVLPKSKGFFILLDFDYQIKSPDEAGGLLRADIFLLLKKIVSELHRREVQTVYIAPENDSVSRFVNSIPHQVCYEGLDAFEEKLPMYMMSMDDFMTRVEEAVERNENR